MFQTRKLEKYAGGQVQSKQAAAQVVFVITQIQSLPRIQYTLYTD